MTQIPALFGSGGVGNLLARTGNRRTEENEGSQKIPKRPWQGVTHQSAQAFSTRKARSGNRHVLLICFSFPRKHNTVPNPRRLSNRQRCHQVGGMFLFGGSVRAFRLTRTELSVRDFYLLNRAGEPKCCSVAGSDAKLPQLELLPRLTQMI